MAGVTPQEIELAALKAGFKRIALNDSLRIVFARGANFLNVHTDGKWAFYKEIADGKRPDKWGKDFDSLVIFLTEQIRR